MNTNDNPTFIKLRDATNAYGVSIYTAYDWVRNGRVRTRRRNGRIFVAENDFSAAAARLEKRRNRNPKRDILLTLQAADKPMTTKEIGNAIGVSHEQAAGILSKLFRQNVVIRTGAGVKADPYFYSMPNAETETSN